MNTRRQRRRKKRKGKTAPRTFGKKKRTHPPGPRVHWLTWEGNHLPNLRHEGWRVACGMPPAYNTPGSPHRDQVTCDRCLKAGRYRAPRPSVIHVDGKPLPVHYVPSRRRPVPRYVPPEPLCGTPDLYPLRGTTTIRDVTCPGCREEIARSGPGLASYPPGAHRRG